VPQPLPGTEAELWLWLQVHTGLELQASGAVHLQTGVTWRDRCRRLLAPREAP